jgi:hypothetical protein
MSIEHACTTDDELTGPQPPPEGDDWQIVDSHDGRTLWRRIRLK